MSQSQQVYAAPEQNDAARTTVSGAEHVQQILDALDDADCRAILEATTDEARTASELSDVCDLALSTAYRKLELLEDAGLLDEQLRLRRSGKHVSEYSRAVEDVVLTLDADSGVELSVTRTEPQRDSFPPSLRN